MALDSRTILRSVLVAALALFGSRSASADVIGLTCDSCWGNTPLSGPLFVEDFEDAALQPGLTFSSGSSRGMAESWVSNSTPSGLWGYVQPQKTQPLDIFFADPVTQGGMFFGHDWGLFAPQPFNVFLSLYNSTNTLLGEVSVAADMGNSALQFIGFESTAPVTRAQIRYGENGDAGLGIYIDDLMFGRSSTAVPEPSTILLMGLGAGAAYVTRRRRKSARQ
jgi:hypothetical protein